MFVFRRDIIQTVIVSMFDPLRLVRRDIRGVVCRQKNWGKEVCVRWEMNEQGYG
jgi:hypothetical protein